MKKSLTEIKTGVREAGSLRREEKVLYTVGIHVQMSFISIMMLYFYKIVHI